jgi:hypothetical protein
LHDLIFCHCSDIILAVCPFHHARAEPWSRLTSISQKWFLPLVFECSAAFAQVISPIHFHKTGTLRFFISQNTIHPSEDLPCLHHVK